MSIRIILSFYTHCVYPLLYHIFLPQSTSDEIDGGYAHQSTYTESSAPLTDHSPPPSLAIEGQAGIC